MVQPVDPASIAARIENVNSLCMSGISRRGGSFAQITRERQDMQPYLTPSDVQTQHVAFWPRQERYSRHVPISRFKR